MLQSLPNQHLSRLKKRRDFCFALLACNFLYLPRSLLAIYFPKYHDFDTSLTDFDGFLVKMWKRENKDRMTASFWKMRNPFFRLMHSFLKKTNNQIYGWKHNVCVSPFQTDVTYKVREVCIAYTFLQIFFRTSICVQNLCNKQQ